MIPTVLLGVQEPLINFGTVIMQRKHRSPDEIHTIFENDEALRQLVEGIRKIPNVEVNPDGEGKSIFKVYLLNRRGPNQGFMRLFTPFNAYVSWRHQQDEAAAICREVFSQLVLDSSNFDGSNVKPKTSVDDIIHATARYARHCGPMLPLQAMDLEPPERVKVETYRILRDTKLARHIKDLHNQECQICGTTIELPGGKRYAEAHHIQPLGSPHNGPDTAGNVMVLCPNHHAMCDYRAIKIQLDSLSLHPDHVIDQTFVNYHNSLFVPPSK